MTTKEIIIQELELFNDSIRQTLNSKRISNTGEAENSLRVEFGKSGNSDIFKSIGIFYLEFLDTGRGGGNPPPFNKILLWAMQKTGQPKEEVWGLAVYVRNKIAEMGTAIFRDNSKGIELDKKTQELKENVLIQIKKNEVAQITQKLDFFKNKYKLSL